MSPLSSMTTNIFFMYTRHMILTKIHLTSLELPNWHCHKLGKCQNISSTLSLWHRGTSVALWALPLTRRTCCL